MNALDYARSSQLFLLLWLVQYWIQIQTLLSAVELVHFTLDEGHVAEIDIVLAPTLAIILLISVFVILTRLSERVVVLHNFVEVSKIFKLKLAG